MISVITINKNNAQGLKATIESVIGQSCEALDFIVIDGDSTDGSKQLLDQYRDKITVAISEPDSGIYNAMNKGIRFSKGDYLLFLNSGDYLLDDAVLGQVLPQLHTHDVISGNIVIEDNNGKAHRCESHNAISWRLFSGKSLYHQATFISRKAFDTYGLYDESFLLGGDYEFFIRLFFRHNASYRKIPEFISYFKCDGISNSSAYIEINRQEAARAWEKNVSKISLSIFKEHFDFEESDVYWLYRKTKTSRLYKAGLAGLYGMSYWFNRLFKK